MYQRRECYVAFVCVTCTWRIGDAKYELRMEEYELCILTIV